MAHRPSSSCPRAPRVGEPQSSQPLLDQTVCVTSHPCSPNHCLHRVTGDGSSTFVDSHLRGARPGPGLPGRKVPADTVSVGWRRPRGSRWVESTGLPTEHITGSICIEIWICQHPCYHVGNGLGRRHQGLPWILTAMTGHRQNQSEMESRSVTLV